METKALAGVAAAASRPDDIHVDQRKRRLPGLSLATASFADTKWVY